MAKAKKAEETAEQLEAQGEVQEKATSETAQQEKPKTVIYVGPPVRGTILHSTFIIFSDGIPEEYRQHPSFKHLFVPPERLDQARREIGKTGSLRNTYYKRAVEEIKQKGGK